MSSSVSSTPTATPIKATSTTITRSSPAASTPSPQPPQASLSVLVVAAHDLPAREPPLGVEITVGTRRLTTGPPVQRHKSTNAFKFAASESLVLNVNSLKDLYPHELTVRVLYAETVTPLRAKLEVKQLVVNEPTWMVLTLNDEKGTYAAAARPAEGIAVAGTSHETSQATSATTSPSTTPRLTLPPSPTIRLQLTLRAPYRREIQWILQAARQWCRIADSVEQLTRSVTRSAIERGQNVIQGRDKTQLMILGAAAVPIIAVVLIPTLLVSVPLALPLAVVGITLGALMIVMLAFVYAGSTPGRRALASLCHTLQLDQLWQKLVTSPTGQQLLFDTGSRVPSPVQVTRDVLVPTNIWTKLALSVAVDALGNASYLLPVAGEFSDIAWAPVQTILVMAMYETTSPKLKYVSFLEEILPFTDVLPSATIGWCMQFGLPHLLQQSQAGGPTAAAQASPTKMDPTQALMMMHSPATDRVQ